MATFVPRMSAPGTLDPYWTHTSKGGKNECILISGRSCIPNCVGYAWGRAYEILGTRPRLSCGNAENWYLNTGDGYPRSKTPTPGSIICWAKGRAGDPSDGAGHVAVVEEVKSNGDVVTSNSAYNGTRFYTKTITKASGYSMGSAYTFQGFIHILGAGSTSSTTSYKAKVVNVNTSLNIRSGPSTDTSVMGSLKNGASITITEESSGKGATKWGKLSTGGWISLDYAKKV